VLYCTGETWEGGRGQSDVWEVSRDTGYVHPTQKPVALAERALGNSTQPGGVVLDLFGGSGSTLLACENLNRRARLVELDPGYCDVIVDRWERHTGGEAEVLRRGP
jgi:DNA modification methylase